ncbi:MAG TPA: hypothetical protein VHC97_20740 [Thermoanaerobaculia bacterium]|jgi:hypothetical protein|nr:hypothetical protein [Thermoanaerobaculia bacterium]
MRRPILTPAAVIALLTFSLPAWADPPKTAEAPAILDLRVNPLMDLHYWVRKLASEKGALPPIEGLPGAVAAVLKVGDSLEGAWGILDASFTEATTAEELARVATRLPETFKLRNGTVTPLRQDLADLAAAYKPLEKTFLVTVWPRHREIAERAAATVRKELFPKAPEVYADVSRHLGVVSSPKTPIPVYLVAAGPFPGAFTMRSQEGPFSVVALEGEPDSQWVEIVVHESIHGLDDLTGEGSVLTELRRRLAQAGADPGEVRDFVHTVMFVQPAATVRRLLNPAHKDYGDTAGYYSRVGRAATVVVPAWRDYLEGRITREAAVERIVKGFAEGEKKEKGGPAQKPSAPVRPPSQAARY